MFHLNLRLQHSQLTTFLVYLYSFPKCENRMFTEKMSTYDFLIRLFKYYLFKLVIHF